MVVQLNVNITGWHSNRRLAIALLLLPLPFDGYTFEETTIDVLIRFMVENRLAETR